VLVRYIEDKSPFISSTVGTQPSVGIFGFWPLRIIVIGLPFEPVTDQSLEEPLTVEPKRIELPHLPS